MSRVHPLWGRSFEQYIDSFKIEASQKRIQRRDDPELEAARLEAAGITLKFHDLANGQENIGARKLEDYITLPMLRKLHKLSCSPITLVDFGHTAHIGGCIKLMRATTRSTQQSGQPNLFSYEYGYLCFRIMAISIGVCLLQRLDQLNETVAEMLLDSSADSITILSRRVSELIQSEVRGSKNERYFDRILGWARLENHPAQEVFATRSDLWTLLNLLYDDRKQFLAVCSSAYSLGLSGLMFVLWRYHRFDCAINSSNNHTSKEFIPLFGDILLRYLLIAPTDQFKPLTIIYEQMGAMARLGGAKFLDLEDSKLVFSVCTTRLAPSDPRYYGPLPVSAIGVFLYQCLPFLKPGCEYVLPSLFQKVIRRLWEAFLDEEMEGSLLVDSIKDGFQFLCRYLELFGPRTALNQDVLSQIVEEIANNDFVDLALRVMFSLDMDVDKDSIEFGNHATLSSRASLIIAGAWDLPHTVGVNQQYQGHIVDFLQTLRRVVHPRLLRIAFKDIVPDLAKYSAYMRWYRLMGLAIGEQDLIMGSSFCFDSLLNSLQQASNLREFEKPAGLCDYSRCPHPVAATYACGICTIRLYCGAKCQNADWCKVPSSSHRGLCPGDIKNLDPLRILDSLKDHVVAMDVTGVPVDLKTIIL